jgi:hypothetical protein
VLDHLNTLNDLTPKIRCQGRNGVDPNLIFGVWTDRFRHEDERFAHHDEVEAITVYRGHSFSLSHRTQVDITCACHNRSTRHDHEVECPTKGVHREDSEDSLEPEILLNALGMVGKESIWRIKGFVRLASGLHILNWAFGRFDLTQVNDDKIETGVIVLLTSMGEQGEVRRAARKMVAALGAEIM